MRGVGRGDFLSLTSRAEKRGGTRGKESEGAMEGEMGLTMAVAKGKKENEGKREEEGEERAEMTIDDSSMK